MSFESEAGAPGRNRSGTEGRAARPALPRRGAAPDSSIAAAALNGASGRSRNERTDDGSGPRTSDASGNADTGAARSDGPDPTAVALAAEIPWTRAPWAVGQDGRAPGRARAARTARSIAPGGGRDSVPPLAGPATAERADDVPGGPGSGRGRKKWVLAGVALAGATALGVPLALTHTGDGQDRSTASDVLSADREGAPVTGGPATGTAPEPSSSGSPTGSPDAEEPDPETEKAAPDPTPDADGSGPATEDEGRDDRAGRAGEADKETAADGDGTASWERTVRRLLNTASDKCLVAGAERTVVQGECGADGWQRQASGDGVFLLRFTSAGMCLDSNGESLYVSPCTAEDPGQLWRMPKAGACAATLTSEEFGEYVTGWNTGSVSLVPAEKADKAAKYTWSVSPSPLDGC
ncbi:hypothetical protein [Streptomyces fumanus]|uniref:Ricin B lectin domain-containing protein n=1 Tax=Streptomyces fumanus TaxID=67302 RepID=A0A919EBL9_9ACTN|nr:hypothetical protein [Streptomyces fumanus]GHF34401.1 hypothetical protein GCM10018772_70060 [Streptomyces fumanus]